HSRYIEALVDGIHVACLYLPNGNPAPGPKFDYKLRWLERLIAHAAQLVSAEAPVVLAGDYNVIPTERDVYKPERWVDDALFRVEVREAFARLTRQGWTDALRAMHPDETIYTYWDYFRDAYRRNAGLRIDHLLLNPPAAARLVSSGVDRDERGAEFIHGHAPITRALLARSGSSSIDCPDLHLSLQQGELRPRDGFFVRVLQAMQRSELLAREDMSFDDFLDRLPLSAEERQS